METNANQKVSCKVNFPYDASEPDELTIRHGDVIRDVERLPGGWWRGQLHGQRGMFPDNFVEVIEQANSRPASALGRCRAVFSYQPANLDELPLCVGDVLEVLGEVEEGWWQGRRQGRVGVFPSNFVVMLDPPQAAPPYEPAPALPPKPVKEHCRVLFAYTAVNEDELTLNEGDIVTIISKDAPDRGWWRGELHGKVGLFPDNFVTLLAVAPDVEEKKPDRPPSKASNIYPILNKYSEKTASVKELTTSKISQHKENTTSKETSTQSTITHTNKTESEKIVHNETVNDGTLEQVKKPPVPLKKSPTPTSGVGSLFSGLKNKMLSSTDKEKSSSTTVSSSGSSSSGEWDRPDGAAASRAAPPAASTLDNIERNSILHDPRAGRVKAPRRRPPSQAFREDIPVQIGLSNGHEAEKPPEKAERTERPAERTERPPEKTERASEKTEEIRPRTREWEKHKAPWMEELKLNQAKKTSFVADGKRSVSVSSEASKTGSTDRILDCGLEEKRSTHSMEMSKSTSSISNRMSILESFEETKVRHSLDSKKDATPAPRDADNVAKPVQSPTAAGRTILSMLDEIKKPQAPPPPISPLTATIPATLTATIPATFSTTIPTTFSATIPVTLGATIPTNNATTDKSPNAKMDKSPNAKTDKSPNAKTDKSPNAKTDKPILTPEKPLEMNAIRMSSSILEKSNNFLEKTSTIERIEKSFEKVVPSSNSVEKPSSGTLERRVNAVKTEKVESNDALIAQLNNRISNLEKLIEVQDSMFKATIEEFNAKLKLEVEKRQALQAEVEKLAQCVTQALFRPGLTRLECAVPFSQHKENTTSKETSTQSTITHTNKTESEKIVHNETVNDGTLEQVKKPPVPLKKSPTPTSGVGSLFSGLKNKMLSSTDKEKSSSTTVSSSGSSSSGEWDRPDGAAASRAAPPAASTLDNIERNSILHDPRAGRVKAPRRRPPSQAFREDIPVQIGLSNGHEAEKPPEKAERTERPAERTERPPEKTERASEKTEEIRPRTREWEKHKAPWMEELKLNQAKKTSFVADGKRSVSVSSEASKTGSTDRILDCGLEEKRSTHSMEMSKSTSSISNRMSILESFEETKVRHSLDSKKDATPAPRDADNVAKPVQSPTAAGRTILSMLDEIKKPQAPPPPISPLTATIPATLTATIPATFSTTIPTTFSATIPVTLGATIPTNNATTDKSPNAKMDKSPNAKTDKSPNAKTDKSPNAKTDKPILTPEKPLEMNAIRMSSSILEKSNNFLEKTSTIERIEKSFEKVVPSSNSVEKPSSGTLERRVNAVKTEKVESNDALIAQLNNRISNLEKLIEVQDSMFKATIEEFNAKLKLEVEKRQALQAEVEKLAQCVTQV